MVGFLAEFEDAPLDYEAAVTAMLGHRMTDVDVDVASGEKPVLSLHQIRLTATSQPIDFEARDGEVIAFVGLLGSGKSKLAEAIYGIGKAHSGDMTLDGVAYRPNSVREAVAKGVFMSPKDRGSNAVIADFDIANNMTLPFLSRMSLGSFLKARQIRDRSRGMIEQLGVVCQSEVDGIGTLSGGNQQKVMIARWLLEPCRVLLLDEPFQGVDIGARRDIGKHIRASAKGRATLVFMAEIDEALEIADRIVVMNEGAVTGEHINKNIDLTALVSDISGAEQDHIGQ